MLRDDKINGNPSVNMSLRTGDLAEFVILRCVGWEVDHNLSFRQVYSSIKTDFAREVANVQLFAMRRPCVANQRPWRQMAGMTRPGCRHVFALLAVCSVVARGSGRVWWCEMCSLC